MELSSYRRRSKLGLPASEQIRPTSRQDHHGRMDTSTALTHGLATTSLMERYSTYSGSAGRHRKLATSLQHRAPACPFRISVAGTRGVHASLRRLANCARPTNFAGQAPCGEAANHAQTSPSDYLVGADHPGNWIFNKLSKDGTPCPISQLQSKSIITQILNNRYAVKSLVFI